MCLGRTVAAAGWVSSADTKLLDHILLHHLLDLVQAKLATVSGLLKHKNTLHIMQSLIWREGLSSSQTNAEHLQAAHALLNAPGLSLDAAMKNLSHPTPV
ncbi:hypothetical protein BDR07DRAFT_1478687 [Suillus spraguei]|nr:hypothetical protein BDR07DRAFT_1478687 [Suillus spraguei]